MDTKRKNKLTAYISTILIYIGAPLVAVLPEAAIGWLIYTVASIFGMVYTLRIRDRAIFLQFIYYCVWNVIAVITRML